MTISAKEAREITDATLEERRSRIFGKIDALINKAIYDGDYSVTTPIISLDVAKEVISHYTDLGYEITNFNNNMYGISW